MAPCSAQYQRPSQSCFKSKTVSRTAVSIPSWANTVLQQSLVQQKSKSRGGTVHRSLHSLAYPNCLGSEWMHWSLSQGLATGCRNSIRWWPLRQVCALAGPRASRSSWSHVVVRLPTSSCLLFEICCLSSNLRLLPPQLNRLSASLFSGGQRWSDSCLPRNSQWGTPLSSLGKWMFRATRGKARC